MSTVQLSSADLRATVQAGIAALQRGDPRAARPLFERIIAAGQADASVFLGLAYACSGQREQAAALAAVDRALQLEANNMQALLLKADLLAAAGDDRGATSFYEAVVKVAPAPERLPPGLRKDLERAQAMVRQYAGKFASFMQQRMQQAGLDDSKASQRFAQSMDLLLGKKEVFLQSPRFYYFPGLPNIQFFDRDAFPWLDRVEAATDDIRAELLEILKEEAAFTPYIQGDPSRPQLKQNGLFNNPDWSAFYLWKNGEFMAENAARCPKTLAALADVPMSAVPGRAPSVLFSLLRPGARIPPHTGVLNTRMICHLPLIVPPGCGLRVGNETRAWVEGKAWLFDDSIEHEAWNTSDQTRVILLFEAWRPELSDRERTLVSTMLTSIDAYGGVKTAWDM